MLADEGGLGDFLLFFLGGLAAVAPKNTRPSVSLPQKNRNGPECILLAVLQNRKQMNGSKQ